MQLEEKHIHQANSQAFYEWLDYTDPQIGMPDILYFNRIIVALGAEELNVNTALQLTNLRNHYFGAAEACNPHLMPEKIFAHVRDKERYAFYDRNDQSPDEGGTLKAKGKLLLQGTLVRHICLVEYDQLDEATRRVQSLGNAKEDFKATDCRIICHFPTFYEILKSMKVGAKNSHSRKNYSSNATLPALGDSLIGDSQQNKQESSIYWQQVDIAQ